MAYVSDSWALKMRGTAVTFGDKIFASKSPDVFSDQLIMFTACGCTCKYMHTEVIHVCVILSLHYICTCM